MTTNIEDIVSPCIGVCTMSEASGLCQGCFRSVDEIREWWNMPSDQRNAVMEKLDQRQNEYVNFD
jgi:predicted Fe-S protein YdhL (DUF1289 family)